MTKAATKPATSTIKNVHEAIVHVMNQVGYVQKEKKGLPYTFASEAAFIKAIRPEMVEIGLVVYPIEATAEQGHFMSAKGNYINTTLVHSTYRWYHAPSNSSIDVAVVGKGMDSGDKDANKAMTIALKYALRQTLLIETGDDPDETPSSLLEQATELGGIVWTEAHTKAMQLIFSDADDVQLVTALGTFAEVTGWDEKTDPAQFKLLGDKYKKQKTITQQDGEAIHFKDLVERAFSELQREQEDDLPF